MSKERKPVRVLMSYFEDELNRVVRRKEFIGLSVTRANRRIKEGFVEVPSGDLEAKTPAKGRRSAREGKK